MSTPERFQFTSSDGLSIACAKWGNHHEPRGVIQIAHGLGEHMGRFAESVPAGEVPMKLMNAAFEPARTPMDWLSRDNAEVDKFIDDPLCFPALKPESMESFLDAFPRLADPREIRKVRDDLPIYIC